MAQCSNGVQMKLSKSMTCQLCCDRFGTSVAKMVAAKV
jgi:hypothetical protein